MLHTTSALLMLLLGGQFGQVYDMPPEAAPPYHRVRYEPSSKPGELIFAVTYTVWIPPQVKTLRGVIVHQHGCGEGSCKSGQTAAYDLHWQALAKKYDCALLGPSYEQPEKADCGMWCDSRNGSDQRYQQALEELAAKTKHPELATVPWALWGHSGGATWAGTMLMMHPERIAAVWLRSGAPRMVPREGSNQPALTIPDAALGVPVISNLGTQEGVTDKTGRFAQVWAGTEAFFLTLRGKGALIGVAVDPNSSHDCGNSRYLAIPWFDACLAARLPETPGAPLKPMPVEGAWLAPLLGDTAVPAAMFSMDLKTSSWLPDERTAKAWMEYTKNGNVSDVTPPPAPNDVRVSQAELTWDCAADFESGIASFTIERNGVEIAQVPEKPRGNIGRPVFQITGYSDSPTPPLALMRYRDASAKPGETYTYTVRAVNSVGLKSEASTAAK